MGRLGGVASSGFDIGARKRFLLVVLILDLVPEVVTRQIGCVVPGVIVGRLIDLGQLFFRGVDPARRVLGCITSNLPQQDRRIAHCNRGQRPGSRQEVYEIIQSFRNWPFEMTNVPRVLNPSSA